MKIYAISDLHLSTSCDKPMDIFGGNWEGYTEKIIENWENKITDDDLVLIAGDISWAMRLEETKTDLEWIDKLPGKKIIIKGNHEYWWKSISAVREVLPDSIMAIQNDSIKIGDYIICGTRGWTVPEENKEFLPEDEKIYKREAERLKLSFKTVEKVREEGDVVIALVHYPPFNVHREDNLFTEIFENNKVDIVVYGHLHGKSVKADKIVYKKGVKYYLTSCDQVDNDLVLIEI